MLDKTNQLIVAFVDWLNDGTVDHGNFKMIIHTSIKDELCFSVNDYLLKIQETENGLSSLERIEISSNQLSGTSDSLLLKETEKQLRAYFDGRLQAFDLPLDLSRGTEFQQIVWQQLQKIPYAEVITYKELAEQIGKSKAYRAVGTANGANPLAIIVPCHRVVASTGLGGYAYGLQMKEDLLSLERANLL